MSSLIGILAASSAVALAADKPPAFPGAGAFVPEITSRYLAVERGKTFLYEKKSEDGLETTIVEVTHQTRTVLGVATTLVRTQEYLDGAWAGPGGVARGREAEAAGAR